MKISKLLADHPILLNKWENFKVGRAYSKQSIKEKHRLTIQSLQIKRKDNSKEDFLFKEGINYIDNEEIFYILKFILTGKIQKKYKETVKELNLELSINEDIVLIHIKLSHPTYAELTDKSSEEIFRTRNLKELKSSFNNFFQNKLNLPYLNNSSLSDKLFQYPITFATYFNCFFIDLVNPYKLFLSERSIFWRKRALQIIVGFRGISLIAFFKDLLTENTFHEKIVKDTKLSIEKDILCTEERRPWQTKFLELIEKERKLKIEVQEIENLDLEGYHSDVASRIKLDISKTSKSLQSYKTKELLILKEIKYLGGDFQKRRPVKTERTKEQYAFYIPGKDSINKEKIDILIGDYYINLSKIEILTEELKDLSLRRKEELKKIQQSIDKRKEKLRLEIKDTIKINNNLLCKESISIERNIKELLQRELNTECLILDRIISGLKQKYGDEHKKALYNFLALLRDKLIDFFEDLAEVSINKHYIPTLQYKDGRKIYFPSLSDKDKSQFTVCFYISLIEFSLDSYGHHPLVLFLMDNFTSLELLKPFGDNIQVFSSSTDLAQA